MAEKPDVNAVRCGDSYREIVEGQSEPICRFETRGLFCFVNQAFIQTFAEGETRPANFFDLAPEQERLRIRASLASLNERSPTGSFEHRVIDRDSRIRWFQWNIRAFFGAGGEVRAYQAVGRDITTRKIAEEALLQVSSEKESLRLNLEAVFQSIPDGILTIDQNFSVVRANKAVESILGSGAAEPGQSLARGDEPWRAALCEVVDQTIRTRQGVREFRIDFRQEGLARVLVANSSPLLDHHGAFSGTVLVVRDITRLVDLERKLSERHRHQNIIGKSPGMLAIYELLEQLAAVDTTVLVLGESGTGKELVVDALHFGGPRAKGPLVKVNCSALSENLLESELFGHVKGAFTGAVQDSVGRFQAAEGGTIFLDEIGDISPRIQLKLLRGLERKEFERVGDNRTYRADVRVVAATNVDLLEKVRQGLFREDLYYRLKVVAVRLPALRDRKEDIPLLTDHFLRHFCQAFGKNVTGLEADALAVFMRYDWPGNVRELKHAMEHACLLCRGERISVRDLPSELIDFSLSSRARPLVDGAPESSAQDLPSVPRNARPRDLTRDEVLDALSRCSGNKAKAARLLGMSRRTLYRKLDDLGISAS